MNKLYGLLLCGGRSSRMGQDKARLMLDGQSLLQRGLALLAQAGCQQVFAGGDYPDVPAIADLPRWQGRGPLAGIASALMQQPDALWLILPVDMPGITAAVLQRFLCQASQSLRAGEQSGMAVADSQFPLLLQGERALPVLEQLLESPEGRMASVGALIRALQLPQLAPGTLIADPQQQQLLLCNTNTPEEWHHFRQEHGLLPTRLDCN